MVRIINYAPKFRQSDSDNSPLYDEDGQRRSATAEDTIDDLVAGLTHRPKVAQSDVASPDFSSNKPKLAKLPSVEEFHFDEAAARNMASKLNGDPVADNWNPPRAKAPPRRSARGLFWSLCTSLLLVLGTSAAFGFIQPLNDLLPTRMAGFLSDLSGELSASLVNRADTPADIEVVGGSAGSGPPRSGPDQRLASAAVARPVSTTSITAEVRPSANSGGSGIGELGEPPGATSEKALQLGATVLELGNIDSAEFATSKSELALALTPSAAPSAVAPSAAAPSAAPAAAVDAGSEGKPGKPLLQRSVKADPLQLANTRPAVTPEPVTSAPPPAMSSLSAAQIDRLLARGEALLQNGDIVSARMLFLRVAAAGDRRGAKGVGMTYDPRVYARLPVAGLTPDREQAEIWYKKAGVDPAFTIESNNTADTPVSQQPGSAEWNAACARKYKSFEPSTGLYTAHSGVKRQCSLL
jgi:hypothetical protein